MKEKKMWKGKPVQADGNIRALGKWFGMESSRKVKVVRFVHFICVIVLPSRSRLKRSALFIFKR